jgi:hypothetical protein
LNTARSGYATSPRRQRPGRDLVGERLEEVEVAPVDQRDVHACSPQAEGSLQAAEAAADDHDPMGAHDATSAPRAVAIAL